MGRAKLSMELIRNKKSHNTTFQKRKNGLMKKTYELATLCGLDACTTVFGPINGDRPIETDTWPPNPDEVRRIINMYKAKAVPGKRSVDLSDFFEDQKKKVQNQIVRTRRDNNAEANYTASDDPINQLSHVQLRELLDLLDGKIEVVMTRIEFLKMESQRKREGTASGMIGCSNTESSQSHTSNMQDLCVIHHQQSTYVKPLDFHYPIQCPSDEDPQMLPIDLNPMVGPSMMMLLNDNYDFTQFGSTSSNSNILYAPYTAPLYHDPTAVMMENVLFNNPGPSMSYYAPVAMQPYVQCLMPSSFSPQLQPMLPYYELSKFSDAGVLDIGFDLWV